VVKVGCLSSLGPLGALRGGALSEGPGGVVESSMVMIKQKDRALSLPAIRKTRSRQDRVRGMCS